MTTKKLKNWQINDLYQAIHALSGRPQYPKDGDGKFSHAPINVPFKFGDKAIYALAKTLSNISTTVNRLETAQKAAVKLAYPDGPPTTPNGQPETSKCDSQLMEIANDENDVEVHELDINQLKIAENNLAPSIVSRLMPMLTGELT